jgi:hypothetical protein
VEVVMETIIQVGEWLLGLGIRWIGGRHSTNRAIRVENHERYISIYREFGKLFDVVQWHDKISPEDLLRFKVATHGALWLFGPEIKEYAQEVFDHGRKFALTRAQLKEMGMLTEEREKLATAHDDEWAWFYAQYEVLDEKFFRYLNLNI